MDVVVLSALPKAAATALDHVLADRTDVRVFDLDLTTAEVGPCLACGKCNEAGQCVLQDAMTEVLPRIASCDCLVLATPIVFGVHHPLMKKAVDRLMPLGGSLFAVRGGEMHHAPRYDKRFAMLGIGVLESGATPGEENTFRDLIARHAVNIACSRQTVVVLGNDGRTEGAENSIRSGFETLGVGR